MVENLKLKKDIFEKEIMPLLNKFYFSSDDPFLIPNIENQNEYNHLFNIIYHAAIYKHLCFYKDLQLNFEEYSRLINTTINFNVHNGFTYINYFNKPIIKIGIYKDENNEKLEAIYPLDKDVINNDIQSLNISNKQDSQLKEADEEFNSNNPDIDDIEFEGFE